MVESPLFQLHVFIFEMGTYRSKEAGMIADATDDNSPLTITALQQALAIYGRPDLKKATWQIIDTFVPYAALWVLLVFMVQYGYPYWITLAMTIPAGTFLVRIFIIFHDCCHGSFFTSLRANRILGNICGILTFTSFESWRASHLVHHATAGDLDRRGVGDVNTMTVEEYLSSPGLKRLAYRLYRNPFIMFFLGPAYMFLIDQRFSRKGAKKNEKYNVFFTNIAIIAVIAGASFTIGLKTYLMIQLPIMLVAGAIGIWMFYIQHQFAGVYWARHNERDPLKVALLGSSYYKLPKVLQWLTGNIGLHHIHHIRPRIPNYNLQQCYDEVPAVQTVKPLTVRQSLKSVWMNMWDENSHSLVSFRSLKALPH